MVDTQDQLKQIESFGFKVLLFEKVKFKKSILLECSNKHKFSTTIKKILYQGYRCPSCSTRAEITTQYVINFLRDNLNYKLLSEHHPFPQKLTIECDIGHVFLMSWKSIKRGSKCKICSIDSTKVKISTSVRLRGRDNKSVNRIKETEKFGYKLLLDKGKNVELKCPNNHLWKVLWRSFRSGIRCPVCQGNKGHDVESIKNVLLNNNYTFVSKTGSSITIECPNNHKYSISRFRSFLLGNRCKICAGLFRSFEEVQKSLTGSGLALLSTEYKNNNQNLELKCSKGHLFTRQWNSLKYNKGCPKCNVSQSEKEILSFVYSLEKEVIEGDRELLNGKELDIFIPSKKIAIEHCGVYYHAVGGPNGFDMWYHYRKWKSCEKLGIVLLTIFEDEWLHDQERIKGLIKSYILGTYQLPPHNSWVQDRRYPIPFNLRGNLAIRRKLSLEYKLVKGTKRYLPGTIKSKLKIYDCGYDIYERVRT